MKCNIKKRTYMLLANLTVLSMLFTGCSSGETSSSSSSSSSTSTSSSSSSSKRPDTNMEIKIATTETAIKTGQVAMPWRTISFISNRMYRNLFLATVGELEVAPDLAKSYTISNDGLTYEIILNDDLLWSDGETLDMQDVVFSIETFLTLAQTQTVNNIFLISFSEIVGVDEFIANPSVGLSGLSVDGNKLTINLKNPNNLFLAALSQFVIFPEHCLENVDPSEFFSTDLEYWQDPVVNGMYKFGEFEVDDYIRLVYNENYSGTSQPPYINSILLRADFDADELDYSETNDVSIILDYRSMSNQTEHIANSIFYRYFVCNIDKGGEIDPVLSDVRVRQALMHAIDREDIVKEVYYGIGTVNNTAAVQDYDNPIEFDYSYDPEKAIALLEEAEYDFDRPITLLYYYSDDTSIKFMDAVGEYLEAIGLTVDIFKGNLYNEESDYYDLGLKGLPVFSIEDWYNEYMSSSQLHVDVYGGEPMFDDLVIDLKQAQTVQERNNILAELQNLEYELLYKMPVFVMGHKAYVSDNVILPDGIEFGDSKYRYDMDFEQWKTK